MKDCCIAGLRIGEYLADSLTGTDLIACLYIDLAQVTIDCQIVTVTDDHRIVVTGHYEYTGHFTVEYRAGISSRCRLDIGNGRRPRLLAKSSESFFSALVMA